MSYEQRQIVVSAYIPMESDDKWRHFSQHKAVDHLETLITTAVDNLRTSYGMWIEVI